MKTKISKRMLSIILAVLMVVTSIPIVTFSTFAATARENLDIAMQNYESKIETFNTNGKILNNMGNAYDAYVDAQKALDAVNYGGQNVDLQQVADDLQAEVDLMTEYNVAFNGTAYYCGHEATDCYSNVIYTADGPGMTDTKTVFTSESTSDDPGVDIKYILTSEIVIVYDGVHEASIPAVLETKGPGKLSVSNQTIKYVASTHSNLYFDNDWKGYMDGNGTNWKDYFPKNKLADSLNGTPTSLAATTAGGADHITNNKNTSRFWWNKLIYHGTGNTSTYYDKFTNPSATSYITFTYRGGKNTTFNMNTSGVTVYVINYGKINELLTGYYNTLHDTAFANNATVAAYREGGLKAIMDAIQNLTSDTTNPNKYSYGTSNGLEYDVQQCATGIMNVVNANTGKTVGMKDADSGYTTLRSHMPEAEARYSAGQGNWDNSDGTWSTFCEKYILAKGIFENIQTNGYNNSANAATRATELHAAYEACHLVETFTPVNTAQLEIALENAIYALENPVMFVNLSSTGLEALVNEIKNTVWNGHYPDESSKWDDSTAHQQGVATYYQQLLDTIVLLNPNVNDIVPGTGGHSVQSLVNYVKTLKPGDYVDFSIVEDELEECEAFIHSAFRLDGSVAGGIAQGQADYRAMVLRLYNEVNRLVYSFTKIPDRTVVQNNTTSAMGPSSGVDEDQLTFSHSGGDQSIYFSYTNSAIIFIKTHSNNTVTIPYGTAVVKFGTKNATTDRVNNMLDSITIAPNDNATSEREFNKGDNDKPSALSDDQKAKYAPCLSMDGFSLSNFRIMERLNCNSTYIAIDTDGTQISDYNSSRLTSMLNVTDGTGNKPCTGGVFVGSVNSNRYGYVTLKADLNVAYDAPALQPLSADTLPTVTPLSYTGHNFGALTVWNTQSGLITYQGYSFFRSNATIDTYVNVVDISYLVDLVDAADEVIANSFMYEDDYITNVRAMRTAAQANLDYNNSSISVITNEVQSRYSNLWNAYKNPEQHLKKFDVVFNYKTNTGADTSTTLRIPYGTKLTQSDVTNISVPSYNSADGSVTYNFNTWSPAVDYTNGVTANREYTATYNEVSNLADWKAYNTAKSQLLGALREDTPTYTVASLQNAAQAISELSYFTLTDAQQATYYSNIQTSINNEKDRIIEIIGMLTLPGYDPLSETSEYDDSVAEALARLTKAQNKTDPDMYPQLDDSGYTAVVNVAGINVRGYVYIDQNTLDGAITTALNGLVVNTYNVYVDGVKLDTTPAPYGTEITLDSPTGGNVAWTYSYAAPSTNNVATEPKYVTTDSSYTFMLVGDTYITTADPQSSAAPVVKIMADLDGDKMLAAVITATDGTITMPKLYYAFYNFAGYSNDAQPGDTVTVTEDMIITASFTASTKDSYRIAFYDGYNAWCDKEQANDGGDIFDYNDLVQFESGNDAFCYVIATALDDDRYVSGNTFTLLAYGNDYSFYACKSYSEEEGEYGTGIVALSELEYKTIIQKKEGQEMSDTEKLFTGDGITEVVALGTKNASNRWVYDYPAAQPAVTTIDSVVPIYNDDDEKVLEKLSMIGTFTLPEDYSIVECGFIVDLNKTATPTTMKLEKVGSSIKRRKASRYTCGNQFVINVINPGYAVDFNYRAYAVVSDGTNSMVVYSDIHNATNNF